MCSLLFKADLKYMDSYSVSFLAVCFWELNIGLPPHVSQEAVVNKAPDNKWVDEPSVHQCLCQS